MSQFTSDAQHSPMMGLSPPGGYGVTGCGDKDSGLETTGRGTQTPGEFVSFSPQTCLELLKDNLLTNAQLERETMYFKCLFGPTSGCKSTTLKSPALISRSLTKQLQQDADVFMQNCVVFDQINNHFFMLLDKAEKLLETVITDTPTVPLPPHPTPAHSAQGTDSTPVRFLDISIKSTVDEGSKGLNLRTIGDREVDYFGALPYSYGSVTHQPQLYPDNPIFKTIEEKIATYDSSFNLRDYTCLVTRYKDGGSHIPAHSDNETSIAHDSNIYTVSFGAERTLIFHNTTGPLTEHYHTLRDGSIHVMSRDSQLTWEHSIPPDPSCKLPRLSFTFRRLVPHPRPTPKPAIPPIAEVVTPHNTHSPNKRVLLLTDSVNIGLKTQLFRDTGLTCIKKPLFELSRIDDFEHEFLYTDYVVISSGINDISRYGHSSESIAALISGKLRLWVNKYPNTVFIFNSLLYTRFSWLNKRVSCVNRSLFHLSLDLYDNNNYWFLDTQAVMKSANFQDFISHTGNGIHISHAAAGTTHRSIVDCVTHFNKGIGSSWPLRLEYRRAASSFHAWRRQRVEVGRRSW